MSTILVTKLYIPQVQPERVSRPHLFRVLDDAHRHSRKLILLSAPPGFGKTTLVAEWLRQCQHPAAWLSLDKDDNDPVRFWRYVGAALQTVDDRLGQGLEAPFGSGQPPALEVWLASLINLLMQVSRPFVLVIDDYHLIESVLIHDSLSMFLDRMPPHMTVVILTRADPPLALSRRRGMDQIAELRAADLRFSYDEAQVFLNIIHALNLSDDDVSSLEDRTEGWIVGLHLAARSLKCQADRRAFISSFAGDDRYIVGYLLDEVLYQQPPQVQSFLLQTAILERLCGPLCDAVLGLTNAEAILHQLEETNLFIVPLDNRRHWYRYHHLFADLLRRHLDPAEIDSLVQRACAWYEAEGYIVEAIAQAFAAPTFDLAADLLNRHALTIFFRGETLLVHRWLSSLPEEILRTHPLLAALYANTVAHAGLFQAQALTQTKHWLDTAEQTECDDLARTFIALSRAYVALWKHDPPQTVITLAQQALDLLPTAATDPNYLRLRSGLTNNLGMAYLMLADEEKAMQAFEDVQQIGRACDDHLNVYAAISTQCSLLRRQGRLPAIADLCRRELQSGPSTPYAGAVYIQLGEVLLGWNELDAAEQALLRGLELARLACRFDSEFGAQLALADLQYARGEVDAALQALERLESQCQHFPYLQSLAASAQVKLWIMRGAHKPAFQWAAGRQLALDSAWHETLVLLRVLIAQHKAGAVLFPEIFTFLEQAISLAESAHSIELAIELWMLQALALSDTDLALASLNRALVLAEPGGYVRLFLNEGEPIHALLRKAKRGPYVHKLLAAWRDAQAAPGELLSQREMEVLRLLAAGRSNAELAQELVVAVNTAKKHVANILHKLDVPSRAKAVQRARELGLLE